MFKKDLVFCVILIGIFVFCLYYRSAWHSAIFKRLLFKKKCCPLLPVKLITSFLSSRTGRMRRAFDFTVHSYISARLPTRRRSIAVLVIFSYYVFNVYAARLWPGILNDSQRPPMFLISTKEWDARFRFENFHSMLHENMLVRWVHRVLGEFSFSTAARYVRSFCRCSGSRFLYQLGYIWSVIKTQPECRDIVSCNSQSQPRY